MKRRPITSFNGPSGPGSSINDLVPNDGKSRIGLIWEGIGKPLLTLYTSITTSYFLVMGPTHLGVYLLGKYTLVVGQWLLYGGIIVGVAVFLLGFTLTVVGLVAQLTSK